jgi:hypothetical protein
VLSRSALQVYLISLSIIEAMSSVDIKHKSYLASRHISHRLPPKFVHIKYIIIRSSGSSVSIVSRLSLDDLNSIPDRGWDFSPGRRVQTVS